MPARDAYWWTPPDPIALTPEECDEILAVAQVPDFVGPDVMRSPDWTIDSPAVRRVVDLLETVARDLWRLPVAYFGPKVRTYGPGAAMTLHSDYDPSFGEDFPACTFATSVQLSAPEDYVGGDVVLADGRRLPRDRGTVGVWDALTPHRVTRLVSGQRSALVVFAVGWPTIREARAAGWPDAWT